MQIRIIKATRSNEAAESEKVVELSQAGEAFEKEAEEFRRRKPKTNPYAEWQSLFKQ
jgi:hypothetical protein